MSAFAHDLDFTDDGRVFFSTVPSLVIGGEDAPVGEAHIPSTEESWWFSGMTKVPENISDVVVGRLEAIPHVKAVLMGRSGEVYHIWTMIDDWTVSGRRAVYAAQRELLARLGGFELDFYVVAIDEGESPESVVSDIPTVFRRAT